MTRDGSSRLPGTGGGLGTCGGGPGRAERLLAHIGSPNRMVAIAAITVAIGLIPWIVVLGFTLPPRYNAGQWPLLWIGYDTAEVAVLSFMAWAAWYRRQILGSAALVAAVLLFVDAWFDIVTSLGHADQWITLATGLGAEMPIGVFCVRLYRRLTLRSIAAYHQAAHDGVVTTDLHDAKFIFNVTDDRTQPPENPPSG